MSITHRFPPEPPYIWQHLRVPEDEGKQVLKSNSSGLSGNETDLYACDFQDIELNDFGSE